MIQTLQPDLLFTKEPVIFSHTPHAIWTLSVPKRAAIIRPLCRPWLSPPHPRRPLRPQPRTWSEGRLPTRRPEPLRLPTCLHSVKAVDLLPQVQPHWHGRQAFYINDLIPCLLPPQLRHRRSLPRRRPSLRPAPRRVVTIRNPGAPRVGFKAASV